MPTSVQFNLKSQENNGIVHDTAYDTKEELANTISHGVGVILGVIALVAMLAKGFDQLDAIQLTGVTVYGSSIILLFLCSTLYHGVKSPVLKKKLKIADHCAIYLLIAGTYTPLMLIGLQGSQASWILGAIWALAIGGIAFKTLFIGKFKWLSLSLYLVMGWLCMLVVDDLVASLSELGFNLLLAGGIFYSVGVIFYVGKKIPYNHAIWHMFVLGGAFCHFFSVYFGLL